MISEIQHSPLPRGIGMAGVGLLFFAAPALASDFTPFVHFFYGVTFLAVGMILLIAWLAGKETPSRFLRAALWALAVSILIPVPGNGHFPVLVELMVAGPGEEHEITKILVTGWAVAFVIIFAVLTAARRDSPRNDEKTRDEDTKNGQSRT